METRPTTTDSALVIAIDSSTTATKALIVDNNGHVLGTAKSELTMTSPEQGFYEQDPHEWWSTTSRAIGDVLNTVDHSIRDRIRAICVTHQRETFGLFQDDGTPLRPGILWLDERAVPQIEEYGSPWVTEVSGKPAGTAPSIYKIAWLKENENDTLKAADHISDVGGYINFQSTGNWTSSVGSADTLSMFNIVQRQWDSHLLEIAGVRPEQLTRLCQPGEPVGNVRPDLAKAWGLPHDVAVLGGCGDGQAASLGTASLTSDCCYLNLGTAVVAGIAADTYKPGTVYRTYVAGNPDGYIREVVQHSGAYLTTWFRENFGDPNLNGAPDPALDKAAEKIPPGSEGLITVPYWNAVQSPYWDSIARGVTVGWHGGHTRAHMYRSLLEAIGMEMRTNLDAVEESTGVTIRLVRAVGGGTHSQLWCQIMADVLGVPIEISAQEEVSALGAAVIAQAFVRAGEHAPNSTQVVEVSNRMYRKSCVAEPDSRAHAAYMECHQLQKTLYPKLKAFFQDYYASNNAK